MSDLSITAANVKPGAGAIINQGIVAAATTVTQGQTLYVTSSNTLGLADSDGTSPASVVEGIALSAGSAGQTISYIKQGSSFEHGASGVVSGDVGYQSDTPGATTITKGDLETGDTVTVLWVATSATTANLKPIQGGVI